MKIDLVVLKYINQFLHWFERLSQEVRLVMYILSLYAIFMTWGFLQEKITTTRYVMQSPTEDEAISQQWVYPMMLNTIMTGTAAVTAFLVELCFKQSSERMPIVSYKEFWKISLTAAMASPIGYYSLKFISYPMMILTKSCKPVPVMFVGALLYRKSYAWYKYASVLLLCGGISLFTAAKSSSHKQGDGENSTAMQLFGLFLVLFNLCLDGITSNEQDHVFSKFHPTSLQMMKYANAWQAAYLSLYLVFDLIVNGRYSDIVNSLYMMLFFGGLSRDILIFCLCSCLGQLILYGLIKEFGSLVWITVAVSRQLFTILLSVFIFGHNVNGWQWFGIVLVFGGLSLEIVLTYMTKPKEADVAPTTIGSDVTDALDLEAISSSAYSKGYKND